MQTPVVKNLVTLNSTRWSEVPSSFKIEIFSFEGICWKWTKIPFLLCHWETCAGSADGKTDRSWRDALPHPKCRASVLNASQMDGLFTLLMPSKERDAEVDPSQAGLAETGCRNSQNWDKSTNHSYPKLLPFPENVRHPTVLIISILTWKLSLYCLPHSWSVARLLNLFLANVFSIRSIKNFKTFNFHANSTQFYEQAVITIMSKQSKNMEKLEHTGQSHAEWQEVTASR